MTALLEAANALVLAIPHVANCHYVVSPANARQDCSCGAWERTAEARGELLKVIRAGEGRASDVDA